MGKWTLAYHDDALQNKMKTLVTGAIKRIQLEEGEPSISYETFVEELDEGDSFTTTLIDVLVKEMADRRTRTNALDRRLISERTAKALRMQAAPLHVYRGRRISSRLPTRPNIMYVEAAAELTDDDDDSRSSPGDMAELPYFEGARLSNDLYDAYTSDRYRPSTSIDILDNVRLPETTPLATGSPDTTEPRRASFAVTSPRPLSPVLPSMALRTNIWSHPTSVSTGPSTFPRTLRRPPRSHTIDFDEFTQRRRSSARQSQHEPEHVRSEDPGDGTWRFRSSYPFVTPDVPEASTSAAPAVIPRRRLAGHRRQQEMGGAFPWSPDTSEPSSEGSQSGQPVGGSSSGQTSSQLWHSLTASAPLATTSTSLPSNRRASIADINEARRQVIAPRLRRGGVRAPESLLSRYASPTMEQEHRQGDVARTDGSEPAPTSGNESSVNSYGTRFTSLLGRHDASSVGLGHDWADVADEPTHLPTPRSISPHTEVPTDRHDA